MTRRLDNSSKSKESEKKKNNNNNKNTNINSKRSRNLLREPSEEEERLTIGGSNRLLFSLNRSSSSSSSSNSNSTNDVISSSSSSSSNTADFSSTSTDNKQNGRLGRSSFSSNSSSSSSSSSSYSDSNASKNTRRNSNLSSLLSILFGGFLVANFLLFSVSTANSTTLSTPTNVSLNSTSHLIPTTTISNLSTSSELLLRTTTNELDSPEETTTVGAAVTTTTTTLGELDDELELTTTAIDTTSLKGVIEDVGGETADLLSERLRRPDESVDSERLLSVSDVEVDGNTTLDREDQPETELPPLKEMRNTTEEQLRYAMETYERWRSTGDDLIEMFSRKMLPLVIEHGYEVDAGTVTGLLQVFNGIRAIRPWALKLLDASAKLTPGLLVGTQADFGDFDECLNIRSDDPSGLVTPESLMSEPDTVTGLRSSTLVGRYCLADIEFPKPPRIPLADGKIDPERGDAGRFEPIELRRPLLNFSETAAFRDTIFVETANFFHMLYVDPIRVGICLTNKIDPEHFEQLLNKLLEHFRVRINFHGRCVTKYDKTEWTIQQRVSAWILVVACSLVLISTILDVLHTKLAKFPLPESLHKWQVRAKLALASQRALFISFSLIHNSKRLFKAQTQIKPLHIQQQQHQQVPIMAESPISTRTPTEGSSSESESSPSIERRSSLTSSALHLIGSGTADHMISQKKLRELTLQFQHQHSIEQQKRSERLTPNLLPLHGIRVITMTWMIVNHTYLFGGFFVLWAHRRLIDIAEWPKSISFQLVLNGWLTVETYFFLSALIIVLNVMPLMKAKKFAYFSYVIHRLIRLLPAYVGLVSLNFLWPLISSGPVWLVKGRSFIQTPCENYLWTNFLFINNWIWPEKQCMVHTWFLSADFQLYLLAPVIVFLLSRRPVFGHSINILIAIVASVFSGFVIYANKLMPTTLINKLEFDSIKQQLSYSYFATYQHMGPYCLGILIGYLLHKRPQVHLPKHLTWLLWILLPPLSFTTLLLTYLWNGAYDDPALINPSPLVSALYVAIHRTIWTSLLAWIVFACATGRAKIMSNFLSHSIFIPLSRLSFSIYLVHLPVIMFRALNLRHTIEWTDTNILWEACGNFVVSVIVGYFVNIAFESPIINLEHVIFRRPKRQVVDKVQVHGNSDQPQGNLSSSIEATKGKDRNVLQPQLDMSKTSSESNDSDDNKSVKFNDQSRKLSDSGVTGDTSIDSQDFGWAGKEEHFKGNLWQNNTNSQMELQSLSIRDELTGDESAIFGVQPATGALKQLQMAAKTPDISRYIGFQQNQSKKMKLDRLGTSNMHPVSLTDNQLDLANQYKRSTRLIRPSQYVTLARTSRFNHDTSIDFESHRPHMNYQSKARSQLGRPISRDINHDSSPSTYLEKQRTHLINRRQGRYNTLTGTGAREWRQHYEELQSGNWRTLNTGAVLDQAREQRVPVDSVLPDYWNMVQPGLMIPRIDSSTLRRQKRAETASSIVEESSLERS